MKIDRLLAACGGLILATSLMVPAHGQRATSGKGAPVAAVSPEAAATVVIYNASATDAAELARFYASRRGIPGDNVVSLKCSTNEEITRVEYDKEIAQPLRETFLTKSWWDRPEAGAVTESKIKYVALIRGIPLKIQPHFEPYEGNKPTGPEKISTHNEAAVDSEIAILGVNTRQISGGLNNPYFRSYRRIGDASLPPLLLVCRLDAPTADEVRRMIEDSLAAEARGLKGFAYIDARGTKEPGLAEGDKWLLSAAHIARRKGMPVILDQGEGLYPATYPMNNAGVYLGWYAENVAGPFVRPGFRFERGAIAVHIHSFSAASLRDARRFWCAPLLAAGASATLGNVYEPYLGLTPQLDVFMDRLRSGFTFAESAYMSQPYLSWMTTFIGDPLYRPFKTMERASAESTNPWEAYERGAQLWFEAGPEQGAAALKQSAQKLRSGMIMEGLGLLQLAAEDLQSAVNSFEQAATLYRDPQDIVRTTVHQVFQLKALNRTPDAINVARKRLAHFRNDPVADVLRAIEADMTVAAGSPPREQ
jgi:uncharacterized protein (TIGR03790 family)